MGYCVVASVTGLSNKLFCFRTPTSGACSNPATTSTANDRISDCCPAAAVVLRSPARGLHGEEAVARNHEHLLDQLESDEDAGDADGKLYCESFRATQLPELES